MRRVAVLLASTAVFLLGAEALYRWLGPDPRATSGARGYYADADRVEVDLDDPRDLARAMELVEAVPDAPRHRLNFKGGVTIHLCYDGPRQPYFDERGCVPFTYSSCQIREREELCRPKPPGQRRIVCVGDSFTVGWGVRVEDAWPRLVEGHLRVADDAVRTVNCGASGTLYCDEYAHGLRHRFARFEPDVVLVSLCLNDLLPINAGLSHNDTEALGDAGRDELAWWQHSRILSDLVRRAAMPSAYRLDPRRDWVGELLAMDDEAIASRPRADQGVDRSVFWQGGGPQAALRDMRGFSAELGARLGVVVWPLFQGLGDGEFYPFARIHDLVAAFCAEEGIACLDLLPAFRGEPTTSLWVSPADLHGNARAHRIAARPIAEFARTLLER